MTVYQRYGVYYLPPPGPLADFGATWLGWDIATGKPTEMPEIAGLPRPVEELTSRPRKYGFHATLKPPFHLVEGTNADALDAEVSGLCRRLSPVSAEGLRLSRIGGFLALTLIGNGNEVEDLAAEVVRGLDDFRAAPEASELARRRQRPLTDRQEANLAAWGYPYVMDEFRFHMTLTGHLEPSEAAAVQSVLDGQLSPLLTEAIVIEDVALVGEDKDGMFHEIHRYPLKG